MAYRKSIKEKQESGTYNVTRERGKSNISIKNDISKIQKPDFLDKNGAMIWDFMISQLSEEHIKSVDIGIFSRWCSLFADFCLVTKAINEGGLLFQDEETGLGEVNNLFETKLKISNALINIEKQLGFTPVTRNSVVIPDKEEEDLSQFLELINR